MKLEAEIEISLTASFAGTVNLVKCCRLADCISSKTLLQCRSKVRMFIVSSIASHFFERNLQPIHSLGQTKLELDEKRLALTKLKPIFFLSIW